MKKKREKISGHSGIYRILHWDAEHEVWKVPKKSKFEAAKRIEGKRIYRQFATFQEAKAFLAEANSPDVIASVSMTFAELIERWKLDHLGNLSEATAIRYEKYPMHFEFFNSKPVEEITPMEIDRWLVLVKDPKYLKQHKSTRVSYRRELDVLSQIFSFYRTRVNLNYRCPVLPEHTKKAVVRHVKKRILDLSMDDYKKFIDALRKRGLEGDAEIVYHLALFQYAIFGRIQEAAALHYEDFDLERGRVSVNKKVVWLKYKGRKDSIEDGSKTGEGKVIPLTPYARAVFKEWILRSGVRQGPLFQIDGEVVPYRKIHYHYEMAMEEAGLPFTATHIIRHASLTEFYSATRDIYLTSFMAGHKDVKTTMRYVKVRFDEMQGAVDKMQDRLKIFDAELLVGIGGPRGGTPN